MARPSKPWFRRQTGWWMVTFQGRQRKLARGRKNRSVALTRFHQLMALDEEQPVNNRLVRHFCKAFLRWSKKHHAPDTYRNHEFYVTSFRKKFGKLPVARLRPGHVTRWVDGKQWNATSEYNARRFVFRVFSWAIEQGDLPQNPLKGMKRPKPMPRQRAMSRDEYTALLKAARGEFKLLLFVLWNTGARPAEVRRLRWKQVHDGYWKLDQHKTIRQTGKPRIIHLNAPMRRLMEVLGRGGTDEHVFLNKRGRPWTANAVRLQFHRLKKTLGLADDLCAYLARHAFGTNAILNGVNMATAAQLLGHTSLEMVQKVYCHLADQHEHLQDAVEVVTRVPTIAVALRPAGSDSTAAASLSPSATGRAHSLLGTPPNGRRSHGWRRRGGSAAGLPAGSTRRFATARDSAARQLA
jgi:integrase